MGNPAARGHSSNQHLTLGQIEQVWVNNGGNRGWAPLMAAIAIAESGGTTAAANTTDPYGGSYGLWQINGSHNGSQGATAPWIVNMETPTQNARTAVNLFATGKGAGAWRTDRVWNQWKAAGFPRQPSELDVLHYLGAVGLENAATGAGPTAPSPSSGVTTSKAPKPGTLSACRVGLPFGGCLLNGYQLRALKGGLLVAAGGLVAFVGLAILAAYGFGKTGALGKVQSATRAAGIGSRPTAVERAATPAQRSGVPTPAGERLAAAEEPRRAGIDRPPVHSGPFDERDVTPSLARRSAERRPHSRQHRGRTRAR